MRHTWSTVCIMPVPTVERPVEMLNDDLSTTTCYTSVRDYLAALRRKRPHMLIKSVRHPECVEVLQCYNRRWTE